MNGASLRSLIEGGPGGRAVSFSEHDFGDPVTPTTIQHALGLEAREANFAILRTATDRLVHFATDLPQILHDISEEGELRNIAAMPDKSAICLDLSRQMLCHRMVHPESTFARTMVVDGGVRTGPS